MGNELISQEELDIFASLYNDLEAKVNSDNFDNLSLQELEDLYDEAKGIQKQYRNLELTVKKDGNSIYGSMASIYFSLVDFKCAADITNTGKHFTVLVDHKINGFLQSWNNQQNLDIIREFYPEVYSLRNFTEYKPDTVNDVCIYGDTDSRYVDLPMIYNLLLLESGEPYPYPDITSEEGLSELADFANHFVQKFVNMIIKDSLDYDIGFRQARPGYMKMAHEITGTKSIFRAKKNYVIPIFWKDGRRLPEVKLKTVGVEMQKGGMNPRIKKILKKLVNDYIIHNKSEEFLRQECLKLIKYIKNRGERKLIYRINGVNDLHKITFDESIGKYKTDASHQGMKIALFWYNFIHENNLTDVYKPPFNGQKMYHYYDVHGNIVGVPDDIDIDSIKGLPQPDYTRMLKDILVKNLLKYISDKRVQDIKPKDVDNFLAGIQKIKIFKS